LLFQLEKAVSEERQKLEIIQQKAEERYEQLMNGIDEIAYSAVTIDTSVAGVHKKGPKHLERLGRQITIKPKDFDQFDSKIDVNGSKKINTASVSNGDAMTSQKNLNNEGNKEKTKEEMIKEMQERKEFEMQLNEIKQVMIDENKKQQQQMSEEIISNKKNS